MLGTCGINTFYSVRQIAIKVNNLFYIQFYIVINFSLKNI